MTARGIAGSLSIRTRMTVFVVLALGILIALMVVIQFRTSLSRIIDIEQEQSLTEADRVVRQLDNSLADVAGTAADWAWWDETYDFMLDGNDEYRDNNLYAEAFTPIGIDLIAYADSAGDIVHGAWFLDDEEAPVPQVLLDMLRPDGRLTDFSAGPEATNGGIVHADGQAFLATSRQILRSDTSGPAEGVLLMARAITEDFAAELATLTDLDLVVETCSSATCRGQVSQAAVTRAPEDISSRTVLPAVDGSPVLSVTVTSPRTVYRESLSGIQRVLYVMVAVGLMAVLITVAGIRRLIVDPLERLGATVGAVARGNDPSLRADIDRTDEIGELASGVNVMLARLENSQAVIMAAKQEIEGASEAKSRFLSRFSHELRTPINSVLAYAQLMQLDPLEDEAAESVKEIVTAARHITALVDEFLDIARIEAGAIPLTIGSIAPGTIAEEVVAMTEPLAAAQGTVVTLEESDGVSVLADPLRLRQVMLNLVSNAIKYGNDGGTIDITVRSLDDQVAIDVRDHGAGIPDAQLPRLFIPFDRLDADSSAHQGSGVGLSVTRQLVELMQGTVDVVSEVGVGSTFTVILPVPETHPAQAMV